MNGPRRWCQKHPHRTEEGSKACYIAALQKRVDRRLGLRGMNPLPDPREPLRHAPPLRALVGQLELWVWSEDGNTPYGRKRNDSTAPLSNPLD